MGRVAFAWCGLLGLVVVSGCAATARTVEPARAAAHEEARAGTANDGGKETPPPSASASGTGDWYQALLENARATP
jgi:hypothetical protein